MSGGLAENRSFANECGKKERMIKVLARFAIETLSTPAVIHKTSG
jgi:hypothetical protein